MTTYTASAIYLVIGGIAMMTAGIAVQGPEKYEYFQELFQTFFGLSAGAQSALLFSIVAIIGLLAFIGGALGLSTIKECPDGTAA